WAHRQEGVLNYIKGIEFKVVLQQIRLLEQPRVYWEGVKKKLLKKPDISFLWSSQTFLVVTVAISGALLRMFPALTNAAPLSRSWYFELSRIKNIRLQDYFSGYPDPAGMHSLVSFFSMITQISPEMILHLLGAL